MSNLRSFREFTESELEIVETLEEVCAKYDSMHAEYVADPTLDLLEISRKIDQLRWTTARELGLAALRCDFSQPTRHKFIPLRSLLAAID